MRPVSKPANSALPESAIRRLANADSGFQTFASTSGASPLNFRVPPMAPVAGRYRPAPASRAAVLPTCKVKDRFPAMPSGPRLNVDCSRSARHTCRDAESVRVTSAPTISIERKAPNGPASFGWPERPSSNRAKNRF